MMTSSPPRPTIPVTQLLTAVMQIAAEHHRAGRKAAAALLYEEVLALDPRHADALFLQGVLQREAGHPEEAQRLLRTAAQWATSHGLLQLIRTELQRLDGILQSPIRKPATGWASRLGHTDGCALTSTAQA